MTTLIRNTAGVWWVVAVVVGVALVGTSASWAQQEQLVGSWKVLSYKAQNEGQQEWREPLGPNPHGYVIFTPGGRFMLMITASGRKAPTNDAERAALLNSMLAYSGRYTVDKDQVIIIMDTSWAEAHQGDRQKQVRSFKLEGSTLTWRTPLQIGARGATAGTSQGRTVTEIVMEREQ